jgi:hypothetical protein
MTTLLSLAVFFAGLASAAPPDDIPALPASAIANNTLSSDRDAAMMVEVRSALAEKRDFADDKVPGGPAGWAQLKLIASFKGYVETGAYCGELRRAIPVSLAGAATLLYVQKLTQLQRAEREFKAADASLKAAQNAGGVDDSVVVAHSAADQKNAKRAVDSLRDDVDSLEHLLLRNGWAEPGASGFLPSSAKVPLKLPIDFETDYHVSFGGKC